MKLNVKNLCYEMNRQGIKQRELAKMVGITETSMSRYVNGHRTPRPGKLVQIAKALGCTTNYLLGIQEETDEIEAYSKARILLKEYADQWSKEKKTELVLLLL